MKTEKLKAANSYVVIDKEKDGRGARRLIAHCTGSNALEYAKLFAKAPETKAKLKKAEQRNVELVDELTTALNALLEICELFPNNLLYEKKRKLFKGKIQALKIKKQ